jgi:uridine phosphorylase
VETLMLDLPEHALDDEPFFSAADLLRQRWSKGRAPQILPPQSVVIGYQRATLKTLLKRYRHVKVDGFFGAFHLLRTHSQPIGVLQPVGPGAPIIAAVLEELIAFGVERFVSIGLAGGLQADRHSGDIVIADRALRDEGTSYHYLPPARSVDADPSLVQQIDRALSAQNIAPTVGTTWTTDAPYRETRREVAAHRAEGVQTVEMEAAALFAVGQRLRVSTAAVFVVGDRLIDTGWQPPDARVLDGRLKSVADVIAATLSVE